MSRLSSTAPAVDAAPAEPLLTGIARLKAEQAQLRADRKRVQKELKNAEKRRRRLKCRARQLSDADLVAVLQMRETASAQSAASGSTTAEGSAASTAASSDRDAAPTP